MSLTASLPEITHTIAAAIEPDLPVSAIEDATRHVRDILREAICHSPNQAALIVFDTRCALARALATAYQHCLPQAQLIDFDAVTPEHIQAQFAALAAGDLVVLANSGQGFQLRMGKLRLRGLKSSQAWVQPDAHPSVI